MNEQQEIFTSGTFGDPTQLETLVEYWTKMELLHYPGAGQTRTNLQERLEREREAARMQQMQQPQPMEPTAPGGAVDDAAVEDMARQAAMIDINAGTPAT